MTRAFVGVAWSLCKVVDAWTTKRSSSQKVHARARSLIIEDSSRIEGLRKAKKMQRRLADREARQRSETREFQRFHRGSAAFPTRRRTFGRPRVLTPTYAALAFLFPALALLIGSAVSPFETLFRFASRSKGKKKFAEFPCDGSSVVLEVRSHRPGSWD